MKLLDALLTPEQHELGFWLTEDKDSIILMHESKEIAQFVIGESTSASIQKEAHQQSQWMKSGISFERGN